MSIRMTKCLKEMIESDFATAYARVRPSPPNSFILPPEFGDSTLYDMAIEHLRPALAAMPSSFLTRSSAVIVSGVNGVEPVNGIRLGNSKPPDPAYFVVPTTFADYTYTSPCGEVSVFIGHAYSRRMRITHPRLAGLAADIERFNEVYRAYHNRCSAAKRAVRDALDVTVLSAALQRMPSLWHLLPDKAKTSYSHKAHINGVCLERYSDAQAVIIAAQLIK